MKQPRSPEALHPAGPPGYNRGGSGEPMQTANFETTFDVDGHVETKEGQQGPAGDSMFNSPGGGYKHADLPAMLEFREEGNIEHFLKKFDNLMRSLLDKKFFRWDAWHC